MNSSENMGESYPNEERQPAGFAILTDEDIMPYGKYEKSKTKMKDVPADYLLWLSDNDKCSRSVRAYITDHMDVLLAQAGRKAKPGVMHGTVARRMTRRL